MSIHRCFLRSLNGFIYLSKYPDFPPRSIRPIRKKQHYLSTLLCLMILILTFENSLWKKQKHTKKPYCSVSIFCRQTARKKVIKRIIWRAWKKWIPILFANFWLRSEFDWLLGQLTLAKECDQNSNNNFLHILSRILVAADYS